MPEPEENLEALVQRPHREAAPAPPGWDTGVTGQCECGARITAADLYGARGEVDLGQPRRRGGARFRQYRCPLCGRVGELRVGS